MPWQHLYSLDSQLGFRRQGSWARHLLNLRPGRPLLLTVGKCPHRLRAFRIGYLFRRRGNNEVCHARRTPWCRQNRIRSRWFPYTSGNQSQQGKLRIARYRRSSRWSLGLHHRSNPNSPPLRSLPIPCRPQHKAQACRTRIEPPWISSWFPFDWRTSRQPIVHQIRIGWS